MDIGIQLETLGSLREQFGSDSHSRIPSRAQGRSFEGVADDHLRVDWFKAAVWTGMLFFSTLFWMGMYTLVVSVLR
jgi:hypothetical protein